MTAKIAVEQYGRIRYRMKSSHSSNVERSLRDREAVVKAAPTIVQGLFTR